MIRRVVSLVSMAAVAGACLALDDGDPVYEPPEGGSSVAAGSGGRSPVPDGPARDAAADGRGISDTATAAAGGSGGVGSGGQSGNGGMGGNAGSPGGSGGARPDGGTSGRTGAAGTAGKGVAGAGSGGSGSIDGGARGCKGGVTGMCPTPYSVGASVDELCKAYCDCMGGPCSSYMPANCLATCKTQIDKWDICCRINKCLTRPCDYKDQFEGDCKAASGIQACLDRI